MKLFNEIYGTYYRIAAKALEKQTVSEKEINRLIAEQGTEETNLGLSPMLIPRRDQAAGGWRFLRRKEAGLLERVFSAPPVSVLTVLQKRWLKAMLDDPRINLFMTDESIGILERELKGVEPLFPQGFFRYFDIFSDGDDHADEGFRRKFAVCLDGMKNHSTVILTYKSGKGKEIKGEYLPLKIEYSFKNDKFRLYCRDVTDPVRGAAIMNIGRITRIRGTGHIVPRSDSADETLSEVPRRTAAVTVRVTEERNAPERFMLEFALFEKTVTRESDTGAYIITMNYRRNDETEVLIRLLSFGPAAEILSPPEMRALAAERVRKQHELFEDSSPAKK